MRINLNSFRNRLYDSKTIFYLKQVLCWIITFTLTMQIKYLHTFIFSYILFNKDIFNIYEVDYE